MIRKAVWLTDDVFLSIRKQMWRRRDEIGGLVRILLRPFSEVEQAGRRTLVRVIGLSQRNAVRRNFIDASGANLLTLVSHNTSANEVKTGRD